VGTRVALVLADDVGGRRSVRTCGRSRAAWCCAGWTSRSSARPGTGAAFDATGARVISLTVGVGVGAVTALRKVLRESGVDVIHAYGLRAGLAASLARTGLPLVVDWPGPVPAAGAAGLARRALARTVSAAADLTLAASTDLVATAGRLGAREVVLAPVIAPELGPPQRPVDEVREDLGVTGPMVLGGGPACTPTTGSTCWSRRPRGGATGSRGRRWCWRAPGRRTGIWPNRRSPAGRR
jgi:hypothetical protein